MVYGQRRGPLPPHSSSARSSGSWVARSDLPPGPPTWPPDSQHGSHPKGDGNNAVRNPLETVTNKEEDVVRAAAFQVSEPVEHHVRGLNCSRVPRRFPHPFPMTAREAVGRTDVQSLEHRRRGRLTELLSRQYAGPDAGTEMGL